METVNLDGRENVLRYTDELIAALKATPTVRRFAEASRRFEADQEVQALLETVQRFQRGQQTGEVGSHEFQDVRRAQARLQNHRVVQEFVRARDAVGEFFKETNKAISEVLGLDVGQTAGPAGGCC